MLDEVIVVGYSAEKKKDLTGSVSVVKMQEVSDTPTGNVLQALQGRVAGMTVTTDGTPGGNSTSTSIRGASSFRSDANGGATPSSAIYGNGSTSAGRINWSNLLNSPGGNSPYHGDGF